MLEGISLDLAIESFSFLFYHQLVYKRKLQKMELRVPHVLHLFNIFHENDGKENCAQVLEEEIYKMFCTKSLNDEHDCNVVSMNSLNIHDANDVESYKPWDAMFDGDDIFCPPSLWLCISLASWIFKEFIPTTLQPCSSFKDLVPNSLIHSF